MAAESTERPGKAWSGEQCREELEHRDRGGGVGHPVIGDGKYGGSGQENMGDGWGAQLGGEISRKLHLHARWIAFDHPVTGLRVTVTAPLPDHMTRTWRTLGWSEGAVPADPFAEET